MTTAAQGFHAAEHTTQWVQYHVLGWSARASNGLLSLAKAEWGHFIWHWLVLLIVIALVAGEMRGIWAWLLLAWATAHTVEHTYMFVRHLQVLGELRGLTTASRLDAHFWWTVGETGLRLLAGHALLQGRVRPPQ